MSEQINSVILPQIRDDEDEPDAFTAEPAVVLGSRLSGRRHVRVPEVVHA